MALLMASTAQAVVHWEHIGDNDPTTENFLIAGVDSASADDGFIDGIDLTTIITNWGMTGLGRTGGDLNDDGTVEGNDYSAVLAYWGTGTPPEPSGVPEPATLALLLIAGLALGHNRPTVPLPADAKHGMSD